MLNKKTILMIFMLTLSTLFPYLATQSRVGLSSPETSIYVDPPENDKPICATFNITVSIAEVPNLKEYEFELHYNKGILSAVAVSEDLFFNETNNEEDFGRAEIYPNIGKVWVRAGVYLAEQSKSGSGPLVEMKFKCIDLGVSALRLEEVELLGQDENKIELTWNQIKDGKCAVTVVHKKTIEIREDYTVCHDMHFDCEYAFKILRSNVVLDLNGFTIGVSPGPTEVARTGVLCDNGVTGVIIKNGNLAFFQYGITIRGRSDRATVSNITVLNFKDRGIDIRKSHKVTVVNTTIKSTANSGMRGICITECENAAVRYTTIKGEAQWRTDKGIHLEDCTNVTVANTDIIGTKDEGIDCIGCKGYIILENNTLSEGKDGIVIAHAEQAHFSISNNTIVNGNTGLLMTEAHGNIISNNTLCGNNIGVLLFQSDNNTIYHNNFMDNKEQQAIDKGNNNQWNLPYPHCGNFWSNYVCADHCCGVSVPQIIGESDGIADMSYPFDPQNSEAKDEYPLIDPWGSKYWVENVSYRDKKHPLAIYSNSSITLGNLDDFDNKPAQISFTVNSTDTPGFCNIIIWSTLINGAFHVSIDNDTVPIILMWEKPKIYTLIHFTYCNGTHNVQIVGEVPPALSPFDLNGDGKINVIDLAAIAQNYSP